MDKIGREILTIAFLLTIFTVFSFLACTDSNEPEPQAPTPTPTESIPVPTEVLPSPQPSPEGSNGFLEIVYFHRAKRCSGCIWAEDATTNTLQTYFSQKLANGDIKYLIINLQDEANAEIVDKYNAHSSSLYINEVKDEDENFEEISGIWTKLSRDEAFTELVKTSIEEHLGNL